jgi:hypothetical protein
MRFADEGVGVGEGSESRVHVAVVNSVETYSYTDTDGHDASGCMTAIGGMSFGWDVNDHLATADLGGGGTVLLLRRVWSPRPQGDRRLEQRAPR